MYGLLIQKYGVVEKMLLYVAHSRYNNDNNIQFQGSTTFNFSSDTILTRDIYQQRNQKNHCIQQYQETLTGVGKERRIEENIECKLPDNGYGKAAARGGGRSWPEMSTDETEGSGIDREQGHAHEMFQDHRAGLIFI